MDSRHGGGILTPAATELLRTLEALSVAAPRLGVPELLTAIARIHGPGLSRPQRREIIRALRDH